VAEGVGVVGRRGGRKERREEKEHVGTRRRRREKALSIGATHLADEERRECSEEREKLERVDRLRQEGSPCNL